MANGSDAPENPMQTPSKKPSLATVLIPVAAILALVLVALAYLHDHRAPGTTAGANQSGGKKFTRKVGEVIPDFELKTVDGKTMRLSDIKAKVVLINFWATWCGPCVHEMPSLQRLADSYAKDGLTVIGVSLDENPAEVLEPFRKKHGIRFASFTDAQGELADQFDVSGLPLTLVVNANRKLLLEQMGDEDWFDAGFRKQFEIWLKSGS